MVKRKVDREMKAGEVGGGVRIERLGGKKAARTQCVVGTLDVDVGRADGLIA